MEFVETTLPDVIEVRPKRFGDHRGWFSETYRLAAFVEAGLRTDFVQDNESFSSPVGTLRGIHFQIGDDAQAKLVRVVQGSVLDVAVDLRRSSPTFGRHVAVELSADAGNQLFVPVGFGHAFCTLEPDVKLSYKVAGGGYAPHAERAVRWNDPALAIEWPDFGDDGPVLSDKDAVAPLLADQPDLF